MKKIALLSIVLAFELAATCAGAQQGNWRAASSTAKGVTGDVTFLNEKIAINFAAFPLAQIRDLKPDEITAAFNADSGATGTGNLYRVSIPAARTFLHHNTLCGSDETQWVITFVSGHNLQMAFFSGTQMPVLTPDALANTTSLCGTYSYVR